ncbi:MAG: Riboflavin biosynthesis protein RibF [Firmicutes bacterium]|nr:Riboflavin biosynthesis protein RibF [Bacillota bacterium]
MLTSAIEEGTKVGAVCLGTFDGVHLGHQAIMHKTCEIASEKGALAAVFTFYPHPGHTLGKQPVQTITTRKQRARLFAASGIDLLVEHPFTTEFSSLDPESFVRDVLWSQFKDATLVAGFNYTFGYRAQGNVETLRSLGQHYGFAVLEVPPVLIGGEVVSSTRLRREISLGNLKEVSQCLGRDFSLQGSVVAGDGRGRKLGFPTANLHFTPEQMIPPSGVYVVYAEEYGYGVGNLGRRPTFPQADITFEVHFFSPTGTLYGHEIEIAVLSFLRPERKFPDPTALRLQVSEDIARATRYSLAHAAVKC